MQFSLSLFTALSINSAIQGDEQILTCCDKLPKFLQTEGSWEATINEDSPHVLLMKRARWHAEHPQSASLVTRASHARNKGTNGVWKCLAMGAAHRLLQWELMPTSTSRNSHLSCLKSEIKWAGAGLSLWPSKGLNKTYSLRCHLTPCIFWGVRPWSVISFLGFLPCYTLKAGS